MSDTTHPHLGDTGPYTPPAGDGLQPGTVWAGYELLRVLGRGGMGVVYQARQRDLGRVVALKIIRPDRLDEMSEERRGIWLERFRAETRAAARLEHPHALPVFEVGEHQGCPFYAMRYVAGRSLDGVLRDGPVEAVRAATWLLAIARAVQAAHDLGVLHRDLKPHNVLVDGDGTPYVTDFGLAKWQDEPGQTGTGDWLGTPSYMAPEQARDASRVDARTDVYGLGATLYELLTGRPPFRAASVHETIRQVLEAEPVPPRLLNPALPRDLETIVLKCLAKEPQRRYASARDLADDLERYLAGRPIHARPLGPLGRFSRLVRRHPAAAALISVVALSLIAVAAVSLVAYSRIAAALVEVEEAGKKTLRERDEKAALLYIADMQRAGVDRRAGDPETVARWLDPYAVPGDGPDPRGWEWFFLRRQQERLVRTLPGRPADGSWPGLGPVATVEAGKWRAPDGRHLAVADGEKRIVVRTAAGQVTATLELPLKWSALRWSPRSVQVAVTLAEARVQVWDALAGKLLHDWDKLPYLPRSAVGFSPDGRLLVACPGSGSHLVRIWDVTTGQQVCRLDGEEGRPLDLPWAWSPDSRRLAVGSRYERSLATVHVIDVANNRRESLLYSENTFAQLVAWSPDGALLAVGGPSLLEVWRTAPPQRVAELRGHRGGATSVHWAREGQRLLTAGTGSYREWDVTGDDVVVLDDRTLTQARRVAFAPDGRVAVAGDTAKLFFTLGAPEAWPMPPGTEPPQARLVVWRNGQQLFSIPETSAVNALAWHPTEDMLAVGSATGVRLRSGSAGALLGTRDDEAVSCLAWSSAGRLAGGYADGSVRIWEPDGTVLGTFPGPGEVAALGWDSAACRAASLLPSGRVRLWQPGGDTAEEMDGPPQGKGVVALAAAQGCVASAGSDGRIRLRHRGGSRLVNERADVLAFSPDGRRLVSSAAGGLVQLRDTSTGELLLTLRGEAVADNVVAALTWSPEGRRFALASGFQVRIWEARAAGR